MSTTQIIATIRTTNPALKASLREPTTRAFKATPRGLMAALDWIADQRRSLIAAQGNLSRPAAALTLAGTTLGGGDLDHLSGDVRAEDDAYLGRKSRTKAASEALSAFHSYRGAAGAAWASVAAQDAL